MTNKAELINSWIKAQGIDPLTPEYDKYSWASSKLIDMVYEWPEELWRLIPDIINQDSSDQILGALGAGLIEDLILYHGEEYIDRIILYAEKNRDFERALAYTFLDENDVSKGVYKKFIESRKKRGISP